MKVCHVCGLTLPYTFFNRDSSTPDGYRGTCKKCRKEQMSKYKSKSLESSRRYKKANKNKIKRQNKEYYQRNKKIVGTKNEL